MDWEQALSRGGRKGECAPPKEEKHGKGEEGSLPSFEKKKNKGKLASTYDKGQRVNPQKNLFLYLYPLRGRGGGKGKIVDPLEGKKGEENAERKREMRAFCFQEGRGGF